MSLLGEKQSIIYLTLLPEYKLHRGRYFCLFYLLKYPKYLDWYLVHSRRSINICSLAIIGQQLQVFLNVKGLKQYLGAMFLYDFFSLGPISSWLSFLWTPFTFFGGHWGHESMKQSPVSSQQPPEEWAAPSGPSRVATLEDTQGDRLMDS